MKISFTTSLIVLGFFFLYLDSGALAQGPHAAPLSAPPPTPTPSPLTKTRHNPYNPFRKRTTLTEYPTNRRRAASPNFAPAFSKPNGVDLDVTFISRIPLYNRYQVCYDNNGVPFLCSGTENDKRWPANGETVTFTAHIVNKGTVDSGAFNFKWFIDGIEVASGTHSNLAPGAEGTEVFQWAWAHHLDGERLLESHSIKFVADAADAIAETYESNNSLEDRTDAISLVLALTPALYNALETPIDPKWPFSAEDWLQKQIGAMNAAFARSVYPNAPNGILERVRLDKIIMLTSAPPADFSEDGGFFLSGDDRYGNAYYHPSTDVSGALIHELSHQLGVIDMYNLDVPLEIPQVMDLGSRPVQIEYWMGVLFPGLMNNPGISPPIYDEHSALGLNSNKGYRRGYYGEYMYDIPQQMYLRILDTRGLPAAGVTVKLFKRTSGQGVYGSKFGTIDNSPEHSGVTDTSGMVLLNNLPVGNGVTTRTGHILRDNPFGLIDVGGQADEFLVQLTKGAHQEYQWLPIMFFNLTGWRDGLASGTLEITSHVPSDGAPAPPAGLDAIQENGLVKLKWQPSPSSNLAGYNVYKAQSPVFAYERIVTGTQALSFTDNYDNNSRAAQYAVTAVDLQGRESGFSPLFYAFRLLNPSDVALDAANGQIVLDPQNGYALLAQESDGHLSDTRGSSELGLEYAKFMTRDSAGRLIISHPGDWYSPRNSIRILDTDWQLLQEIGETGSGNGQFQNPAGVATWGVPCNITGPYGIDSHTLLLLHFDGSYNGAQGETGTAQGTTFSAGQYAQGIALDSNDSLWYASSGNFNRDRGAVEMWVRPQWNGNDAADHVFFEIGNTWFNRMRIMKDGGNYLRFILWDSTAEYGVSYYVADWDAGEWHHIAATWQNTDVSLYVDGRRRATSTTVRVPDTLAPNLYVGSSYSTNQQSNATIDELRISDIPRVGNSDTCNYRILAADSGNNRLQVFDAGGNWINAFGSSGSGAGQFNNPQGLAVTPSGRVIVADLGNNRLQVLNFDGTNFSFIQNITADFNQPNGVAAYGDNRILVADTGNNKIKVLDAQGNLLNEYAGPNDGYVGSFDQPRGVTADGNGSVLIADTGNRRVVSLIDIVPTLTPTHTPVSTATPTQTATSVATATATPTFTATPCASKPAKPTLLKPKDKGKVGKRQVSLDWTDVVCAEKYKVIVKDTSTGKKADGSTVSVSNYKTKSLTPGRTYLWKVKACNSFGCAAASRTFTIKATATFEWQREDWFAWNEMRALFANQ